MAHLPDDDLPSNFDVVVDGTGLVQSILAAALARAGKSVLHLDRESYYGEQWASLMHRELEQWIDEKKEVEAVPQDVSDVPVPPPTEDWVSLKSVVSGITNLLQIAPDWTPRQSVEEQTSLQGVARSLREEGATDGDGEVASTQQGDINSTPTTGGVEPSPSGGVGPSPSGEVEPTPSGTGSVEPSPSGGAEPTSTGMVEPTSIGGAEPTSTGGVEPSPSERVEPTSSVGVELTSQSSSTNRRAELNWKDMNTLKRRFTYDILPKVLYCRGTLVDLLTTSNCGRYVEFKAVGKIFTQVNGALELVPCSRADMFSTKSLSMVDKRKMMRFLSFCAEYKDHPEQYQEFEDVPFVEFLVKNDLQGNLRQYIIHCIAMVDETTPTIKALEATKLFLNSLGRFGNAPFLYPIFGVGELPQAFCRLCAVFGGVYCLHRCIKTLVISSDNHQIKAIICSTGQRIACSAAVCSATQLSHTFQFGEPLVTSQLSRAIFIADGPIPNTQGSLASVILPPFALGTHQVVPIRMLQLDSSTNTAVPGTYMIHATCLSVGSSAEVDLRPVCSAYFSTPDDNSKDRPRLLYSLYFNATLNSFQQATSIDGLPDTVLVTSDPSPTMTFEGAVAEAQLLFARLCPGEEFLPSPPDPDQIVYDEPEDAPSNQQEATGDQQEEATGNQPEEATGNQQEDASDNQPEEASGNQQEATGNQPEDASGDQEELSDKTLEPTESQLQNN